MAKTPKIINEACFFPIWMQNFEGQLKKLHKELVLDEVDEYGVKTTQDFKEMEFIDFCLLVYQERPDLVNVNQN